MRFSPPLSGILVTFTAALLICAATTLLPLTPATADSVTSAHAARIVQQYQGVWTTPPTRLTNGQTSDAPLMGNGDVGVLVGGSISNQTFYFGKNDFFSLNSHAIKPLGRVVLAVPGLAGASYRAVQDISRAQVQGTYTLGGSTLAATSWMSATNNVFVTSLTLSGSANQAASFTLQNGTGGTPATSTSGSVLNADVSADTAGPQARIASRILGGSSSTSGNRINLTLQPGTTYTFVAGILSSIDSSSYQSGAVAMVSSLTDANSLNTAHQNWWQQYWSKSYVEIPDKAIEKSWYGSLYLLGTVSRAGEYAPGLWGNWISGSMAWNGDYHTNYNYEATFYSGLATNHIEQIGSYDQPVLDWLPRGQSLAQSNGFSGVLYPVGLSPKGTSADTNLHNQKSNAAFLASNMVMRFAYTRDTSYASKVYPYLKQVGLFWQNYLTLDGNGMYNIHNDAPQEGNPYPQTNSILSLGLVHLLFQGLIDISTALNQDANLRTTWQNLDAHLAPLPTMTRNGQTVFRQTSVGADWVNDGNDIAIQAVYPGSQVGLNSSATTLQTARNTITQLNAWHGGNATPTLYPAAARVGYNPSTILTNLRDEATNQSYNNMAIHHNGGGTENLNVVTSGISEMLLQSFQKDIRVFANWPANTNAKFGDLLAYGNFLISSSLSSNAVQYVRVVAQSGGNLTFTNPWPGQSVQVYRNGTSAGTASGTKITLATSTNETLHLAPAGTPLSTIQQQLAQPLQTSSTASFSTGLEAGNPSPTWTDSVDTAGGGSTNVTGICCGVAGPEAGVRSGETPHAGSSSLPSRGSPARSLLYSGAAQGGDAHAYLRVFDLSGGPLAIGTTKTLSYWIYPQSNTTTPYVAAGSNNSSCVAVDLVFSDGSTLRDSGAVDQDGDRVHPAQQCGQLTLDAWNHVTVNLAANNSNKLINRILIGYDRPSGSGGYRGYVDDITIS